MARSRPARRPARKDSEPSLAASPSQRRLPFWPLPAFIAVFITASVYAFTGTSATWDEPIHLLDGYASLVRHDYRIDPEHPPLARMLGALPLVGERVAMDLAPVDAATPFTWATERLFTFAPSVLYQQNDADTLLYRARFVIVLLGVLLGAIVFFWTREWLGDRAAALSALFVALEPNLLAHFSLLTTDGAMTCFGFATLYMLWRWTRSTSVPALLSCAGAFALSAVSKFTAALLVPTILTIVVVEVWRGRLSRRDAMTGMLTIAAVTWLSIWAVYGFRYAPSAHPDWLYSFHSNPYVIERTPTLAAAIGYLDDLRLLPNAFSEGFLFGQSRAQLRWAFLAGDYSETGWWYFFPVALLIKSPISLLLLVAGGLFVVTRRRPDRADFLLYIVWPPALLFGVAMMTTINIGVRHLLPVVPFLIVIAAAAADHVAGAWGERGRYLLAGLVAFWALEDVRAYPHPLAFFNAFVGGPSRGAQYLVDSNLDWGQDLKGLKAWMDDNHVGHVNLAYFGNADPDYYHLSCTLLNGSGPSSAAARIAAPTLPGYVAVSETVLTGVYLGEHRNYYWPLRASPAVASIGHSIKVYWVEKPWW